MNMCRYMAIMKILYLWQSIMENGSFRIRIIRMLDFIIHL